MKKFAFLLICTLILGGAYVAQAADAVVGTTPQTKPEAGAGMMKPTLAPEALASTGNTGAVQQQVKIEATTQDGLQNTAIVAETKKEEGQRTGWQITGQVGQDKYGEVSNQSPIASD